MSKFSKLVILTGVAFALYWFIGFLVSDHIGRSMKKASQGIASVIVDLKDGAGYRIDPNEILGEWASSYDRKNIGMTFFSDSVQVDYQGDIRKIRYDIMSDTFLIASDTGRITVLNRDILSIRPLSETDEDVNIIFLLDFRRVQ